MTVGALMMVAGAVLASVVFVRYLAVPRRSAEDPATRRQAAFDFAISLLLCSAVVFGGACVLVLGLIVGSGAAAWTLSIPLAPLVLIAVAVPYFRRRFR